MRRLGAVRARPEPPEDLLILMVPGWFYLLSRASTWPAFGARAPRVYALPSTPLRFPANVRIFSLIAVPLSGQVSVRAAVTYGRLRELGTNDGLTLLVDELLPGANHYLGPEDQRIWCTAVFRVVLAELPRHEGR